jgi:hypothetical protein
MWPFKRKKASQGPSSAGPVCPHCRSVHTRFMPVFGSGQADYVKSWRGQRYVTCKCLDCGQPFYIREPLGGVPDNVLNNDDLIDNEDELRAAEDEIKRQIEEDGDHRYR